MMQENSSGLDQLAMAWPQLSERARWEIYFLVVWFVFRSDLGRLGNHLAGAARAAVGSLKR